MLNIYGEKVRLTPAQTREYIALLDGPITVSRFHKDDRRRDKVLRNLVDKSLVYVSWVYDWGTKFERWM